MINGIRETLTAFAKLSIDHIKYQIIQVTNIYIKNTNIYIIVNIIIKNNKAISKGINNIIETLQISDFSLV